MKSIVKGLAVLLVLLMAAFPALGEIERISEEKIPITIAGQTDTTLDYKNTFVTKWVEDHLGFDFTFTMYSKDVIATQFTLMLADNTLPDLIIDFDWNKSEINTYGEEGYFLDMSQYLDVMPNFNAFCETHPDFAAYTRTADGKIYSVNRCRDTVASRQLSQNWISKAWLERVGKEAPSTLDELYELLTAFKQQDANGNGDPDDEIPMALTMDGQSGQRMEWMLKTAFGIYSVNHNYQLGVDESGKVYLAETTENWKDYLRFMHKLYAEKLLDNECFIMTTAEYRAKASSDLLGFYSDWSGLKTAIGANEDRVYQDYQIISYLANNYDGLNRITLYPNYTANARIMISADTQYPEELCRLVDFMFNPEAIVIVNDGIEGETYDVVIDEYGNETHDFKPYWEPMKADYETQSQWVKQYLVPGKFFNMVVWEASYTYADRASDEELDAWISAENPPSYIARAIYERDIRRADQLVDAFPFLVYTNEEADAKSTLATDITTYLQTMKAQFITGEADLDADWDAFQNQLRTMGLEQLLAIEQGAYDRYAAAMNP